jgi:hypothetical protein
VVVLRLNPSGPSLDVRTPEGALWPKPQELLNAILGQLTFDPQAFSRMAAKDRLETLRGLVKLDTDIDALDRDNETDYTERTEWNRKVVSAKEHVKSTQGLVDETMDVSLVDVSALTGKMASAAELNADLRRIATAREDLVREIRQNRAEATANREQAEQLIRAADALEASAKFKETTLGKAPAIGDLIDVTALKQEIDAAMQRNRAAEQQIRARQQLAEAKKGLDAASVMSDNLSAAVKKRDQQKADAMGRAKMPVDGLGFGNGDVTFNDLPFEQASTGQQLRVATAIGMALNPKLRVLCVRDGSLLDEDSRAVLVEMAEEHDFQVWLESCQSNATVGIHISEGRVVAIDGEPVEPISEAETDDAENLVGAGD